MSDQSTQTPPSRSENPIVANIQNNLMGILEFSKKQQWAITNYSVLVYAAIFAITHTELEPAIRPAEKWMASLLVILTWLFGLVLLGQIQFDMGKHRKRLENIHFKFVNAADRQTLGVEGYGPCPALRGWQFLLALIGVVTIGAAIVIYSVSRLP